MKKFIEQAKNDPELLQEFMEFMHGEEEKLANTRAVLFENLNKQIQSSFEAFFEAKGIQAEFDPEVRKAVCNMCRTVSDNLQADIQKHCNWNVMGKAVLDELQIK